MVLELVRRRRLVEEYSLLWVVAALALVGVLAFLNGAAPQVAVEFARKFLPHDVQPTFQELEDKLNTVPAPA